MTLQTHKTAGGMGRAAAQNPASAAHHRSRWLREHHIPGHIAMLVAGPSTRNRGASHRIEFLRIDDTR